MWSVLTSVVQIAAEQLSSDPVQLHHVDVQLLYGPEGVHVLPGQQSMIPVPRETDHVISVVSETVNVNLQDSDTPVHAVLELGVGELVHVRLAQRRQKSTRLFVRINDNIRHFYNSMSAATGIASMIAMIVTGITIIR